MLSKVTDKELTAACCWLVDNFLFNFFLSHVNLHVVNAVFWHSSLKTLYLGDSKFYLIFEIELQFF